jgi:protein-tyrosine kinase
MSLVERALKKLQESRAAAPPATLKPNASPADAPAAPARAEPPPRAARSARTVRIDRAGLRAMELLPSENEERRLQQEFRQIKRPLIAKALARGEAATANGHVILIASALPGDGKTFTSINLAMSMALEKDINVLLVDADVAKRHISRIFDVAGEPGLLDVLREEGADVESMIMSTDIPGFSLLPAGHPSDTATELLASTRTEDIVSQLARSDPNRIVLVDSPPLLLTSESRVLAGVAGQVLLVVRAGATPQQAVMEAVQVLGEGRSVSLVLNQSDDPARRGYYQHYGDEDSEQKAS